MKATKLTVRFLLIISLFASIALADDGHIGGGGLADDGHIGGGGYTCNAEEETCPDDEGEGFADPVLIFVKDYLDKLFG